jgi:N-methylhydantoinase A
MSISPALAVEALERGVLEPTQGSDVTLAAWAVHDIVNENMARAVRRHCLEHGVDPRTVTIVATGGAGPLHAGSVAEKLGAKGVVCPPSAGVASAWGLLFAPRTAERMIADVCQLDTLTDAGFAERLDVMERDLREDHPGEFVGSARLEMRLEGQGYEISVDVPDDRTIGSLHAAFEREYESRFGRPPWSDTREIVNWIVRLTQERTVAAATVRADAAAAELAPTRSAYFGPAHGWQDVRVVSREQRPVGEVTEGPLIIAEDGTTVVVRPGQSVSRDRWNNVHLVLGDARSDTHGVTVGIGQDASGEGA